MTARIVRWRRGKHGRRTAEYPGSALYPFMPGEAGTGLSTVTPSRYAIEVRDKNFNLKRRIEHVVTAASWEWNRFGGCGKCTLKLDGDYMELSIQPDDDIRIYLPNAGSGATLWYRGYVESVTPALQTGNSGSMTVECMGYFGWLDRIIAQNVGSPKIYTNTELSLIVTDLITNFITANMSSIALGTIQAGSFTPDTLSFKSSIKDAIKTIYDLTGSVECGIDANLNFFWYNTSSTLRYVLYIGEKIVSMSDRTDFKSIINQIYFEGGSDDGAAYVNSAPSQSSINRYGRHEAIVSNGSINTASVSAQYMTGIFRQSASPSRQRSVQIKNSKKRFEVTLPIGACAVVDQDSNQTGAIYGATGAGGSGKIYGTTQNGGSGQTYGGVARYQVDRIGYTFSPEDGKINADIQFGTSIGYAKAAASLKQIENIQNALRQRTL